MAKTINEPLINLTDGFVPKTDLDEQSDPFEVFTKPKKPAAPIIRDVPPKPKAWFLMARDNAGLVLKFSSVVLFAYFIVFYFSNFAHTIEAIEDETDVFPLTTERITTTCTKVEHFFNLDASPYWEKIFRSFSRHMNNEEKRLDGLNSFYIGENFCYLRIRMKDEYILEMFNPTIVSFSDASRLYYEASINCQKMFDIPIRRPLSINIKYQDISGTTMMAQLKDFDAAIASQLIAGLQGKSICDGTDKGIDSMF
jgi:peptide deformylase